MPNKLIIYLDYFADENGKLVSPGEYNMPGEWPNQSIVTVSFKLSDDVTIKHDGIPAEMHEDCLKGWDSSLDKMQRLVESH